MGEELAATTDLLADEGVERANSCNGFEPSPFRASPVAEILQREVNG